MKTELTPLQIFKLCTVLYEICDDGLELGAAIHPLWQAPLEEICKILNFDPKFLPTERLSIEPVAITQELQKELETYFKDLLAQAKAVDISPRQLGYRDPEIDAIGDDDETD